MVRPDLYPSGPPLFEIHSADWWVKVLGMLQHNWALIETSNKKTTAYFFHDLGIQRGYSKRYKIYQLKNRCAVVDSLDFENIKAAELELQKNGFMRLKDNPGPWESGQPNKNFYDAREDEEGIYSKSGYWRN